MQIRMCNNTYILTRVWSVRKAHDLMIQYKKASHPNEHARFKRVNLDEKYTPRIIAIDGRDVAHPI